MSILCLQGITKDADVWKFEKNILCYYPIVGLYLELEHIYIYTHTRTTLYFYMHGMLGEVRLHRPSKQLIHGGSTEACRQTSTKMETKKQALQTPSNHAIHTTHMSKPVGGLTLYPQLCVGVFHLQFYWVSRNSVF